MAHILLVDDEPKVTFLLEAELLDAGFNVTPTNSSLKAIELIESGDFDLVITDLSMPEKSGIDVLKAAHKRGGMATILMTAYATIDSAVEAGSLGVAKYIEKPFENSKLVELAHQVLRYSALQNSAASVDEENLGEFTAEAHDIVFGKSPVIVKMNKMIHQVAKTTSTALLTGPSGSGKEIAARLIHDLSERASKPFVAVNCAAITESLLESEMFGHVKGAFTGAIALKRGRFELADSGTIFLDEIGETSWALQTKLLRALEERVITRVGGTEDLKVDVRVIAATNRNLQKEIAAGNFREDLFFRLNVFPIAMPSLAERREDIPEFIRFFLVANKRSPNDISPEAVAKLKSYSWPGNVRELRNTIERAVILAGAGKIDSKHITLSAVAPVESSSAKSEPSGLEESERKMILQALNKCANNKTEAAKMLGITRRRLYSRIKFHNISPS